MCLDKYVHLRTYVHTYISMYVCIACVRILMYMYACTYCFIEYTTVVLHTYMRMYVYILCVCVDHLRVRTYIMICLVVKAKVHGLYGM